MPKRSKVGIELCSIITKIAATISKMLVDAPMMMVLKIVSPTAPVFAKILLRYLPFPAAGGPTVIESIFTLTQAKTWSGNGA